MTLASLVLGSFSVRAAAQDIKYEKYKLDNGMTVILHEDHSLPVASVNIWYRVGSKDEPQHRSGFAHLFEHLMFMGTRRVPGNKFDTIMEGGGGSNNASTSSDRTNYFSHGPASLLPTLLWLDADRLEDLARTMDKDKLDKQRDVVRNERRQSYENRPYGKAELQIQEMMFPPGHPYHIPVIGTHEDLEAATVTDVRDFFATYYVPNNASLVVAGDLDSSKIKPLIQSLFGTLPRGSDPLHHAAGPVKLDSVKRATMLDKVQLPMIAMAFHSPGQYADGDAEMDLIGDVLSEGKTSRLYKRLVYQDKLAVSVRAYQDSSQLGSTFRIDVQTTPSANLDRVENIIDEEVAALVRNGPTPAELEQRKATIELQMLSRLQSIEARADQLNEYEYFWGEPNSFKRDMDRFRNATASSLKDWAARVLTPDARVIMRILPEAPEHVASARDTRPEPLASAPFQPQAPESFKLASGIPVMLWHKPELPLVATEVLFKTGGPLGDIATAGLVSLTADMLEEGAGDLGALEFSDAMQSLGAQFNSSADHETATLLLTVLKRNYDKAAALLADAIRRPRLEDKEWDRVKRLHLDSLRQQDDEPRVVAGRVAARLLFGANSAYGWPVAGTPETVEKLSSADIRRQHAAIYRPDLATIFIAGDISAAEAKSTLERLLGDWRASGPQPAPAPTVAIPDTHGLKFVIVNRPEAVQTVVNFIMPGPRYADENRVRYRLLNTLLGGSFTSRLNQNLREAHGYTYGARSSFSMEPSTGYFTAASSVRANVTGESVKEFLLEIERIRKGDISAEEAEKARETLRTDVIQTFAGLRGIITEAADLTAAGLPFDTLARDMQAMQSVSAADLNKLASPAIPLDRAILVLVGDRASILKQLDALKSSKDPSAEAISVLPRPIEVTVRGEPAGATNAAADSRESR